MFERLIVVGASTDGVVALKQIAHSLAKDFPAPVIAVLHVGRHSQLPAILSRVSKIPALHPFDGEPLYPGRIYVGPPDSYMIVERGRIRVVEQTQQHVAASIDALFCSAAVEYGPAVIGVVLTGYLDDGAEGLAAIKKHGGTTIIQDPAEAGIPSMPLAAAGRTIIDHVCKLDDVGPLLSTLVAA